MKNREFISKMPIVNDYRVALDRLSERWDLLTLLGQMSNIGMDMTQTREEFHILTERLLERLTQETLDKLTSEMEAKAQVAVDVVIRNLFERTADIGFLATDGDIREFLKKTKDLSSFDDEQRQLHRQRVRQLTERFREYVAKYSVYDNIILLSTEGSLLVQMNKENKLDVSNDPLVEEAIHTNEDYVEIYRYSDLQPDKEKSLIYAYRVTESNEPDSPVLGVLCLVFRFEDEMKSVFSKLIHEADWMELALLDADGYVISSSDKYHIPLGVQFEKVLKHDFKIIRFAGREYIAKTCATQGYEGFTGLGWYGHAMIPLDTAFKKSESQAELSVSEEMMEKLVSASNLFSEDLVNIPNQADKIQRELDVTVWNGNVKIANTKTGDNSFSKSLLNEISKSGAKTKSIFENSIANLNQTVISAFLDDAAFYAMLAVDFMDRNLYERANDCRWWALTSRFVEILEENNNDPEKLREMADILSYINNLYTVYTNLFIYDKNGVIKAVSQPAEQHNVGQKINEPWVNQTLDIKDSQDYRVSPFMKTHLYNNDYTYIYNASICNHNRDQALGGIGIVFDSTPQFRKMLIDALPKNEKGIVLDGFFALFIDTDKMIIASTDEKYPVGSQLDIADKFVQLANGEGYSEIIEMDESYYVVGAHKSSGYREYKVKDNYKNDVLAIIFVEIGKKANALSKQKDESYAEFKFPMIQGNEETIELSTFCINSRLYAIESNAIQCSINGQEITPILGANENYLGVISMFNTTIPVVSLRSMIGGKSGYDRERDSIIITRLDDNEDTKLLGLVIDKVHSSPELPVRCLEQVDRILNSGSLVKYIVQPEQNNEKSEMLSIIDIDAIHRAIFGTSKPDVTYLPSSLKDASNRDVG